jgi:hypothetical protein
MAGTSLITLGVVFVLVGGLGRTRRSEATGSTLPADSNRRR